MKYYFLVDESNTQNYYMYRDLQKSERVTLVSRINSFSNSLVAFLYRFSYHFYCTFHFCGIIGKKIWMKFEPINRIVFDENEYNIVYLNDNYINAYSLYYLQKLKKKNVHFVIHYLNAVKTLDSRIVDYINQLSPIMIMTDEQTDANKYGWYFLFDRLSEIDKRDIKIEYDIVFVGRIKTREEMIYNIRDYCRQKNLKYLFIVPGMKNCPEDIHTEFISYTDLLDLNSRANCILEIMQENQDYYTCRLQEAVVQGKKLLSNNPNIKESEYYNPKFMRIFNTIDDLEENFITKKEEVNYKYRGSYSPLVLLDILDEEILK